MRDLDHDDLRYAGQDGEEVTVTVEPENTTHLVTYTLEGISHQLPQGEAIIFTLERQPGGAPMVLQLTFDFSGPSKGKYHVVVKSVENEPNQECVHTWKQRGSLLSIKDYRFFVS